MHDAGMTLAEAYASMSKDNVHHFLHSPYTAKLPGGESLRDVVRCAPRTRNHEPQTRPSAAEP